METQTTAWSSEELLSHSRWVRALALRLVRDAAQADDLVQETLLAALDRRPRTDRPLEPWLRRVLANRVALWRRGEHRRRTREARWVSEEALPSGDELLERAELQAAIAQAVAKLREPYRSVLLLRYYEGLEPVEIARRRGAPAATVRSQLKRGLDELRSTLDGRFGDDRRRWALAAVPLALDAPRSVGTTGWLVAGIALATAGVSTAILLSRRSDEAPPTATVAAQEVPQPVSTPGAVPARSARGASTAAVHALAERAEQPIRGVLVELDSRAPVPHFALEISDPTDPTRDPELLWSGSDGTFETALDYAAGRYMVTFVDHPGLTAVLSDSSGSRVVEAALSLSFSWDPDQEPLTLTTEPGLTYALDLTPPDGPQRTLAAWLEAPDEAQPVGLALRAPVRRTDGETWVRFGRSCRDLSRERPWQLRVQSEDGLWGGEVALEPNGSAPASVPVQLEPRGRVELTLDAGEPLRTPVLWLVALEGGASRTFVASGSSAGDGRERYTYELDAVRAGPQRLFARIEGEERTLSEFAVTVGRTTEHEVALGAAPAIAHVRGELRSTSGAFREPMMLQLAANGEEHNVQPRWIERNGRWVAPFEIANLEHPELGLQLYSQTSHHRWNPLPLRVSVPTDELVLTCLDEEASHDLEVRARTSGNALPFIDVDIHEAPRAMMSMAASAPGGGMRTVYRQVPLDAQLDWFVWSKGCAPQAGDESALSVADGLLLLEVELAAGWGGRVEARLANEPLPGVEVRLDGKLAGQTDERGRILLSAERAPERVELSQAGFRFVGGDWDPEKGKLTGEFGTHKTRFGPHED